MNAKPTDLPDIIFKGLSEIYPLADLQITSILLLSPESKYNDLQAIPAILAKKVGNPAAAGIMLRAGRASFKYLFDAWGETLGMTSLDFRLFPQPRRIRTGLQKLADLFTAQFGRKCRMEEGDDGFHWILEECPFCLPAAGSEPSCFLAVGMLQEFFDWASGGKYFRVTEISCRAEKNRVCEILIGKRPVE